MKREQSIKQRFIALFFLLLLASYVGNMYFFTHEHKVGDVVVVHSHMGSSTHAHTTAAISTIFSISHYYSSLLSAAMSMEVAEMLLCEIKENITSHSCAAKVEYFSLRAPPVL